MAQVIQVQRRDRFAEYADAVARRQAQQQQQQQDQGQSDDRLYVTSTLEVLKGLEPEQVTPYMIAQAKANPEKFNRLMPAVVQLGETAKMKADAAEHGLKTNLYTRQSQELDKGSWQGNLILTGSNEAPAMQAVDYTRSTQGDEQGNQAANILTGREQSSDQSIKTDETNRDHVATLGETTRNHKVTEGIDGAKAGAEIGYKHAQTGAIVAGKTDSEGRPTGKKPYLLEQKEREIDNISKEIESQKLERRYALNRGTDQGDALAQQINHDIAVNHKRREAAEKEANILASDAGLNRGMPTGPVGPPQPARVAAGTGPVAPKGATGATGAPSGKTISMTVIKKANSNPDPSMHISLEELKAEGYTVVP